MLAVGDHPRRCGALIRPSPLPLAVPGSSPQVRGTFPDLHTLTYSERIIPAGAGHFYYFRGYLIKPRDHPRRCGALAFGACVGFRGGGSSPQVRGTSAIAGVLSVALGIIPAGAGHFSAPSCGSSSQRDHPRRCGALFVTCVRCRGGVRIIPAGAGHFCAAVVPIAAARDHPRRCGALCFL